ncbi:MAG: site-specific integrase [Bacteroidaceae bacterium]|nr:site-specific integrase [Bacteroidaceae bacterium]
MASIKVKFRPSTNENKEGTIYYQIIQNRVIRQLKTDYRLFMHEWNEKENTIIGANNSRQSYLQSIEERIDWDIKRLQSIINQLEYKRVKYTADDIVFTFQKQANEQSLFNFMKGVIAQLQQMGKQRTSETYRCTLKSFMQFREDKDVLLEDVDSDLMLMYEAYLRGRRLIKNSTSFYMRILRAVYNRAVEKDLTTNRNPFKHVYTGIDKTVKRAIPLKAIKQIKNLDLSLQPSLDFARDMFLFSFYTRGMSFIDMAYLKKKDLSNGILSYRRRKTGQRLFIRWEKCMQEIVEKYDSPLSDYLLPVIKPFSEIDERSQYQNAMCLINRKLKEIGKMIGLQLPLTMYVARHSWASVAKNKNVPISVISEGMGHDSEMTTQIYLASLDTAIVDTANKMILNSLWNV